MDIGLHRLRWVERHLMAFYRLAGMRGMIVLVSGVSVLLSVLGTLMMALPLTTPEERADGEVLMYIAVALAVPLMVAPVVTYFICRLLVELESAYATVAKLSTTDPLTGSANRRGFFLSAKHCIRVQRDPGECLVGMVDLDRFKQLNDTYGHQTGDLALQRLAERLRGIIGTDGVVGRLGGDEFAFFLVGDQALLDSVRDRIAGQCGTLALAADREEALLISCSIGMVQMRDEETFEAALARADKRLYQRKFEQTRDGDLQLRPASSAADQLQDGLATV